MEEPTTLARDNTSTREESSLTNKNAFPMNVSAGIDDSSFPIFPRAPSPIQDKENLPVNICRAFASADDATEKSTDINVSRSLLARGASRSIIRYGESLGSLFCLTQNSLPEHQALSNDIAHGLQANDTASWVRVLELASQEVAEDDVSSSRGEDLMRLHRRATSRFSSYSVLKDEHRRDVLKMWLSYASAQLKYGSRDEARLTYRNIEKKGLQTGNASFYLAVAEFEVADELEKAKGTLRMGIRQQAEPVEDLQRALDALDGKNSDAVEVGSTKKNVPDKVGSSRFNSLLPPLPFQTDVSRSTKRKAESKRDASPKKSRVDDNDSARHRSLSMAAAAGARYSNRDRFDSVHSNNVSAHRRSPLSALVSRDELNPTSGANKNDHHETHITPSFKGTPSRRKIPGASERNGSATIGRNSGVTPQSLTSGALRCRQPLLSASKTRLTSLGLGRAQRVNPQQHCIDESEDSLDDTEDCEKMARKGVEASDHLTTEVVRLSSSKPVPKITKMDLSYMLNWDPEQSRRAQKDTSLPATDKYEESLAEIKESKLEDASTSEKSSVSTSSVSVASPRSREPIQHTEPRAMQTSSTTDAATANHQASSTPQSESSRYGAANSNPDFLPLVCESNMLRVNNVPYAKLSVIGKGGSCKVYRVLSKECTVLAIKKVKLGGMDKKAINGYANEISLLKRLQGNSSIIQMYDSEVDLSRKAIFVVMEVGEVDLSHVLQKHTSNSGNSTSTAKRQSLSMNFIRLTWQQMLSAVHSIHEERIIHGDLKPANFLFVRGALKLIDFGIAKAIQSDDTTNIYRDSQIGTLNYMSPEAILDTGAGKNGAQMKIGRASDIWSLGCILYQMVNGRTPFADMHMIQKLQAIVNPDYQIQFPDDIDEAALDAMKQCLNRNAELRPPIVGRNGLLNEHCFLHSERRLHP